MTKNCVFFGHRWVVLSEKEKTLLQKTIVDLITKQGIEEFIFGGYGDFDSAAYDVVTALKKQYPRIHRTRALAYYPKHPEDLQRFDGVYEEIYFPEGVEIGPKRYAISRCNRTLAKECDFMVCYVLCPWGGAYRAMKIAQTAGKTIINIADV